MAPQPVIPLVIRQITAPAKAAAGSDSTAVPNTAVLMPQCFRDGLPDWEAPRVAAVRRWGLATGMPDWEVAKRMIAAAPSEQAAWAGRKRALLSRRRRIRLSPPNSVPAPTVSATMSVNT